jgi:transposase
LTGGEAAECTQALRLLERLKAKAILADKGYDADYVMKAPKFMRAEVVIPSKSNRKNPRNFDTILYRERTLIERMFNKLKHFQRVATRYDKTVAAYLAFVVVVGIYLWLR